MGIKNFSAITTRYKINHKVKDEDFNVDNLTQYVLCLQIGNDSFRFCIIDSEASRCLWLEDYRFLSVFSTEQLLDQLNMIYDDHHVLQAGFWQQVSVCFRNTHFTLIPQSLFAKEAAGKYLQLAAETPVHPEETRYYPHQQWQAVNVFSVERKILEWFKITYPARDLTILHQTSTFIEGLLQNSSIPSGRNMYISVEASYLIIVVMDGKKLEFCNIFLYMSVQDFTYYVMLVMDELQLNPDTCKVKLYGELSHDSGIFSNLYKYIRNLSFGNRPATLSYNFKFDEVLDHRYFDLYNIYLCK